MVESPPPNPTPTTTAAEPLTPTPAVTKPPATSAAPTFMAPEPPTSTPAAAKRPAPTSSIDITSSPIATSTELPALNRAGSLTDRFSKLTTNPSTISTITPKELHSLESRLKLDRCDTKSALILRLTYKPHSSETKQFRPKTLILQAPPKEHAYGFDFSTVVASAHTTILHVFPPPDPNTTTECFELAGKKEGQRSSCGLKFLMESIWDRVKIVPTHDAGGYTMHVATFTYVANDALPVVLDSASSEKFDLVLGRSPPSKRSKEFQVDVEVEYHGAIKDHGSRFFTMYGLRLGDDCESLYRLLMEVDVRARIAVKWGFAQVAFWFEGRRLEEGEKVDYLWRENGRKLVQVVCYPREDKEEIFTFTQREREKKRRLVADHYTRRMVGYQEG